MKWAVKPLRSPGRLPLCPDQNNDSSREEDEPEPCQVNDKKITGMFMIRNDIIVERPLLPFRIR
jgi:hypothetical protein